MVIAFVVPALAVMFLLPRQFVARVAVGGTITFLCLLAWLFATGRPLLRDRLGDERKPPVAREALQPRLELHRHVGYAAEVAFAAVWAAVVVAAICSSGRRPVRLLFVVMGAVLALGLMCVVVLMAYSLSHTMIVQPMPEALASRVLRFAALHEIFAPAAVALLLGALAVSCLREL